MSLAAELNSAYPGHEARRGEDLTESQSHGEYAAPQGKGDDQGLDIGLEAVDQARESGAVQKRGGAPWDAVLGTAPG